MRRFSPYIKIALIGLVGSVLLVSLLAKQDVTVYAMDFKLELMIFDQGYTVINFPPLGTIRAQTHQMPLLFSITLGNINLDRLSQLVGQQPPDEILQGISRQLRRQVTVFLIKILTAAFVGGFAAGVFYYRNYRRALLSGLIGLVAFAVLVGSAVLTYDEDAFAAPQYEGVIEAAPWLMGVADEVLVAVEELDSKMQVLSTNLLSLFESLRFLSPVGGLDGELRILHVSDIHNSPLAIALIKQIAQAFSVDVIIDTGDVTDYGTPVEAQLLQEIGALGLPYVFIPGNHDSPAVIAAFAQLENVTVITENVITVEPFGLTVAGISDPAAGTTEMTVPSRETYKEQAEVLAGLIGQLPQPPDVVAAHHVYIVEEFVHLPLLLLHGHSHTPSIRRQQQAVMVDAGTTGGAGVRGLLNREETPFSMVLLHLDRYDDRWVPIAADLIKVLNINSGFVLERQLFPLPEEIPPQRIDEFPQHEENGDE